MGEIDSFFTHLDYCLFPLTSKMKNNLECFLEMKSLMIVLISLTTINYPNVPVWSSKSQRK